MNSIVVMSEVGSLQFHMSQTYFVVVSPLKVQLNDVPVVLNVAFLFPRSLLWERMARLPQSKLPCAVYKVGCIEHVLTGPCNRKGWASILYLPGSVAIEYVVTGNLPLPLYSVATSFPQSSDATGLCFVSRAKQGPLLRPDKFFGMCYNFADCVSPIMYITSEYSMRDLDSSFVIVQ